MSEASTSIRLNPFKGLEGPAGEPVPWNGYGRILSERPNFTLDPLLHAGCYYVQDSSAMFVGHLFRNLPQMPPRDGRRLCVLDLCAAPGGKTTDLSASLREICGDNFLLVSNEVMKQRAAVLCDNVAIWGDPNVAVTSVDPAAFAALGPFFDVIVADVPCSGEGMFRKDERSRAEWSPATVALCASRQRRILADVWPSLKQGGCLVYSTCTYEEVENDANLEWAAATLGGEVLEPLNGFAPYGVVSTRCGCLLEAGVVPGEGQWAGALVKTSGGECSPRFGLDRLHPRRFGVSKGEWKGRDFVPDPDYALSIKFENEYPSRELGLKDALHFLHKDNIVLPDSPLGYITITYGGHPLGFVKNLGKRCNNLHPKGRRILMNI